MHWGETESELARWFLMVVQIEKLASRLYARLLSENEIQSQHSQHGLTYSELE